MHCLDAHVGSRFILLFYLASLTLAWYFFFVHPLAIWPHKNVYVKKKGEVTRDLPLSGRLSTNHG